MRTSDSPGPEADLAERRFALETGVVVGRVDGDVVRALGIPYAAAARFSGAGRGGPGAWRIDVDLWRRWGGVTAAG